MSEPATINPRRRQRRPYEDLVRAHEQRVAVLESHWKEALNAQARMRETLDGHADLLARVLAQQALLRQDLSAAADARRLAADGAQALLAESDAAALKVRLAAEQRERRRTWLAVGAWLVLLGLAVAAVLT